MYQIARGHCCWHDFFRRLQCGSCKVYLSFSLIFLAFSFIFLILRSQWSSVDGRLTLNSEWRLDEKIWEDEGFVNYYYGISEEGEARKKNRETFFAFQDRFFHAMKKAILKEQEKENEGTKKKNSNEEGEEVKCKLDGVELLRSMKRFLKRKGRVLSVLSAEEEKEEEIEEEEFEEFIKKELTYHILLSEGKKDKKKRSMEKEKDTPFDFDKKDLKVLVGLMKQMVLVPKLITDVKDEEKKRKKKKGTKEKKQEKKKKGKKKRKYEDLVKGSCVHWLQRDFRGPFPRVTKFNDLDHILVKQEMNISGGRNKETKKKKKTKKEKENNKNEKGKEKEERKRKTLLSDGHIAMIPEARRFTDHLGKRAEFLINWDEVM